MELKHTTISDPPRLTRIAFRASGEGARVDREAKIIRDYSVVTRGEALGHGVWLDKDFLAQVKRAGNARRSQGIKTRFTHPGLSGDGLGRLLGRTRNFRMIENEGVHKIIGDLHFADSAFNTPEGDLASYTMDLAEETPDLFGASIVFQEDRGEEDRFRAKNSDKDGVFKSPDADNSKGLIHARLAELQASDVVDDPAANPTGMFSFDQGSELAARAEEYLSFIFGLRDDPPAFDQCGPHPERAKIFVQGFFARNGLRLALAADVDPAGGNETRTDSDPYQSAFADMSDKMTRLSRRLRKVESDLLKTRIRAIGGQ